MGPASAQCTASVLAIHILENEQGDPTWTVGGHYPFKLVRTAGGWCSNGPG
ncbi:nuclear transport factor 2 family protein [Streptomyces atroolivaceus]|uniref:nuclear transport factor 2 family protein n=1 Tax=Streptomyces atroolivaceus TaxID=66869 RepID=UPI0020241716|nr:nuclear transport factor 2 family protein [Streptomyces atroolivaceus]